jgi:hypothetical protein
MRAKHRYFVLSSSLVTLAGFVACGFPSVTIGPGGGDGGVEAGTESGGNGPDGGEGGGQVDADVGDVVVTDSSGEIDANSCDPADCDCDKDTYLRKGCGDAGSDPATVDCDDFNPLRNPGSGFVGNPTAKNQDWNCDGKVEKAYSEKFQCDFVVLCGRQDGFEGPVECGAKADFFRCNSSCQKELDKDITTQYCK